MNYRHAYHAGNFADVVKHVLLVAALEALGRKEKPFLFLDVHAGTGMYDLLGDEAGRTGEWREGIGRLCAVTAPLPPLLERYRRLAGGEAAGKTLRFYPGSPELARRLMRPQDRLVLCELHPQDAARLAENIGEDRRVAVMETDGYAVLKAQVPPAERRGMAMIDPPFERPDEYETALKALVQSLRRWASGTYMVWHPGKDAAEAHAFRESLVQEVVAASPAPKVWSVDFFIRAVGDSTRLAGCGLIFVNPPWAMVKEANEVLPVLNALLAQGTGASWASRWHCGE